MSVKKTDTIRINCESKEILKKINEITTIPKGMIIYDALRIIEENLKSNDYNYSKILQCFPRGE